MERLLSAPREISTHSCAPRLHTKSQIKFCRECSLFLGSSCADLAGESRGDSGNESPASPKNRLRYYRTSRHETSLRVRVDHEKNLANMLRKQHKNRFYNQEASHLVVRPDIISFMKKIHQKFQKGPEILHKAVVLMDSVFSRHQVSFEKIELIVLLCLHLASKFDESFSNYDPERSFFKYAQRSYSFEDIINLEKQLVRILDFQFDVQSPFHFLNFFNNNGIVSSRDIIDLVGVSSPPRPGPPAPAPVSQEPPLKISFLAEALASQTSATEFRLDGIKNTGVGIEFSSEDILGFLGYFDHFGLVPPETGAPPQFKLAPAPTGAPLPMDSEIFAELEKCYANPMWALFIELMFRGFHAPAPNQALGGNFLADKSCALTEESHCKLKELFAGLVSEADAAPRKPEEGALFVKETQAELEQEPGDFAKKASPEGPLDFESFLSVNSMKEVSNRTSILAERKRNLRTCPKVPLGPGPIIPEEAGPQFRRALFALEFSDFELTISSNTQTTLRLLNCLCLNRERLPVGLVEVVCSNFEKIFGVLLRASIEVYSLNKFTSVAVAVSLLYISRKLMNFPQVWTPDLALLTGLSEMDIEGCVEHVLNDSAMFSLVSEMKRSFESETPESVFGGQKIICFRNILQMYCAKACKVVADFRRFEQSVKRQLLFDFCLKKGCAHPFAWKAAARAESGPGPWDAPKLKLSHFETNSESPQSEELSGSVLQLFQFELEKAKMPG